MEGSMDDSDLALEAAIIKIGSGDESSGSDNETEPPAPVAGSDADSIAMMNGGVTFQQGGERGCVEGDGGGERQPHALQIPRSQVTLNAIFSDYKLFTVFRRFLKDQCITRNLNFWLACNHYLQLPGGAPEYQEELGKVAKAIYVKYIKISAPQLVQVRQSTKRAIKSLLSLNPKTITPSLFKPAQEEAWELMKRNELKQFLASDMFREMFSEFDDDTSVNMAFQPSGPVLCSVSVEQSSSEDSRSMTSCSTDGGSEVGRSRSRLRPHHFPRSHHRTCSSDTEAKSHHSYPAGPHAKKDKPVSSEDFVAMVCERLMAVQKDRDQMRKRAQDHARKQGKTYDDIIATDWFDPPNPVKYARFDGLPPRVDNLRMHTDKRGSFLHDGISPSHSPSLAPYPNPQSKVHIDCLAQREIQDALKDLEITNQVSRSRRYLTHPKSSSATSSILSYTSDSGVGDSVQWTTSSSVVAASRNVQRFVEGQNQLLNQTSQRDIDAKAAAITLINSSPHAEDLSHRVPHSLSGRHWTPQQHPLARNYTGAYSSDDNASFLTVTSESDLFIPRRYPPPNYSESDEPHHFPRMHHRQLSRPRRTGFKMHQAPPIVEPSHTPTSHPQTPRPSMTQKTSSGVLVLYDLVDISSPSVKRPPFAKKHPSSDLTLAEFKDKIFSRKGDYRFFFKSFCEDIDDAIMEEISDEETILPLYEGKIIARVETIA